MGRYRKQKVGLINDGIDNYVTTSIYLEIYQTIHESGISKERKIIDVTDEAYFLERSLFPLTCYDPFNKDRET